MNVKKLAANDAERWAYAEMFFGEGAGTRRKLLSAEIASKVEKINDYHEHFEKALGNVDMGKMALAAARERKRLDHVGFIKKNTRAIVRGDLRHVSPLLLAVAVGGYYAHVNELDKAAWQRIKVEYRVAKLNFNRWRKTTDSPVANLFTTPPKDDPNVFDINKPYGGL